MDPFLDPRLGTIFSTPQAYEQLYRRGLPPSDFLAPNRSAMLPGERTANEVQTIYRALSGSPERVPMGPPGRRFDWMAEAPRPTPRPPGFPLELLEGQKPGIIQRIPPMLGPMLQLLPTLMLLQGDTDPGLTQFRAEQQMVTPPDRARSVPDRLLAMPHKMTEEQARIQELADMISKRRGRD